jgi:nitrile hydratase subunit beta
VNGVHDLGGMDGFGPVHREPDEPVFHEPWESRVFGMYLTSAGQPPTTLDARRHQLERLDPAQYLSSSYYERWLARIYNALVETRILSRQDIEARIQQFAADPDLPMPRRNDPARADSITNTLRAGRPAMRKIRQKPRFAPGDKIVTRNLNPHGHTRLSRYARGKRGIIVAHRGAHVFPDTNAHGLGENPQHLYTVRIAARELWGGSAEPKASVMIDLWESYLEKDRAAVKSPFRKVLPAVMKVSNLSPHRGRVKACIAPQAGIPTSPPTSVNTPRPSRARLKRRGTARSGRGSSTSERATNKPTRSSR